MSTRFPSSTPPPQAPDAYWLGRWFTTARREGLLALLLPEVWHTLSALLSFTCRDGRREFTVDQLAVALGQPRERALARLEQLTETKWRDQPLATVDRDPHGEIRGATLAPVDVLAGKKAPLPADREPPILELPTGPEAGEQDGLMPELQAVGLNPEQIEWLLKRFPRERLRRQLDWLPRRQARNPAALLIRAVEGDWGAPREAA
jgi:hypothetical protein